MRPSAPAPIRTPGRRTGSRPRRTTGWSRCCRCSRTRWLGADGHDERIGAECEAWQVIEPGCAGPADFIRARDDVVRGGWQLDGLARSWLADGVDIDTQRAQAYAGLGELSLGAAGARLMLGAG